MKNTRTNGDLWPPHPLIKKKSKNKKNEITTGISFFIRFLMRGCGGHYPCLRAISWISVFVHFFSIALLWGYLVFPSLFWPVVLLFTDTDLVKKKVRSWHITTSIAFFAKKSKWHILLLPSCTQFFLGVFCKKNTQNFITPIMNTFFLRARFCESRLEYHFLRSCKVANLL